MTNEATIAGLPVAVSIMDIHTVGAGGGSIARVDEGGSLRVGPQSAGADPGPACYGRSLLPTVTDAHVVLNHFGGQGLLGGAFQLDEERSQKAMAKLARDMSKSAGRKVGGIEAAEGVLAVANTNMEHALRRVSVERGYDTREFALLPFGGAGGLHAVELAMALRIPTIIIPRSAGALSAIGVLTADVVKEQSQTIMLEVSHTIRRTLNSVFHELERRAKGALRREGFSSARQRHERSLAVRYKGQSFELEIRNTEGDIAAAFHRAHRERYGYAQETNAVEIVSARLRSSGLVDKPVLEKRKLAAGSGSWKTVQAYLPDKRSDVNVYEREFLSEGMQLRTPCIVTEYSSTTLIPNDASASVDEYGNLIIQVA